MPRLAPSARLIATCIGKRHPWISAEDARDMILADMSICRPVLADWSEERLSIRSAIRVAERLFPDEFSEDPDCLNSLELS